MKVKLIYGTAFFLFLNITIDAQTSTFYSRLFRGSAAAYFCNENLRGVGDQFTVDNNQKNVQMTGNIKLQTKQMLISAHNISIIEQPGGFIIQGNSDESEQISLNIYAKPISLGKCDEGMLSDKTIDSFPDDDVYNIKTTIFKWDKQGLIDKLIFSGDPSINQTNQKISFQGQEINLNIENQLLTSIFVKDSFKLLYNNQLVAADQAQFYILQKKIIALGNVKLSINDYSLITAQRLEVDYGVGGKIIADQVKSNFFLIR